jgi:hypothetical protein
VMLKNFIWLTKVIIIGQLKSLPGSRMAPDIFCNFHLVVENNRIADY